ncbi:hypothetical protein DL765_001988 [Monosporascus sp. GIB2]|nr:hypothetical protein DL765_001988 [Monosporascus sp. GIB2]
MATQWANTVNSSLFTFVVGPEGREFTIHSGAVLRLSPYFDALINGPMKEAGDRRVVWDDIDEETFAAFSQFAYAGHYATPDLPTSAPEPGEIGEARSSYASRSETFNYSCGRSKRTVLGWEQDFRAKLDERREADTAAYCTLENFVVYARLQLQPLPENLFINARSLLLHAKLYVLADRYCIDALKDLALGKLHRTLLRARLDLYASDCFCELVRFAYTNTRTTKGLDQDKLRGLLVAFGACVFDWFLYNSAFRDLLRDHSEFGLGILIKLSLVQDEVNQVYLGG